MSVGRSLSMGDATLSHYLERPLISNFSLSGSYLIPFEQWDLSCQAKTVKAEWGLVWSSMSREAESALPLRVQGALILRCLSGRYLVAFWGRRWIPNPMGSQMESHGSPWDVTCGPKGLELSDSLDHLQGSLLNFSPMVRHWFAYKSRSSLTWTGQVWNLMPLNSKGT